MRFMDQPESIKRPGQPVQQQRVAGEASPMKPKLLGVLTRP